MLVTIKSFVLLLIAAIATAKPAHHFIDYNQNDQSCTACNQLVSFATRLFSEQNSPSANAGLVNWCVDSGFGANQKMCSYLINDLEKVLKNVNPNGFCERIDACTLNTTFDQQFNGGYIYPFNPSSPSGHVGDDTSCQFCLNIIEHVKGIVSSPQTENELKMLLSKSCDHLGSFKDECVKMLDENLDQIFAFLGTALDPHKVCEETNCCPKEPNLPHPSSQDDGEKVVELVEVINIFPIEQPKEMSQFVPFVEIQRTATKINKPGNVQCQLCKQVYAWMLQQLKDNATEEQIVQLLDRVCDELPTKDKSQCKALVEENVEQLINFLKSQTDPDMACKMMGLCLQREITPEIEDTDVVAEETIKNGAECILCKRAYAWILKQLNDNATEQEIISALDKVCDTLVPQKDRPSCKTFINQYTDEFIRLITQQTDPELACALMGVCLMDKDSNRVKVYGVERNEAPETNEILDHDDRTEEIIDEPTKFKDDICYECQQVMHFLQQELYDHRTEESVQDWVEKNMCDNLANVMARESCDAFVKEYGAQIMNVIALKVFDPTVVCNEKLKVCFPDPETSEAVAATEISTNPNLEFELIQPEKTEMCSLCVNIVDKIDSILESHTEMETDLFQISKQICNQVPEKSIAKCDELMEVYGSHFLEMIGHASDPKQVCKSIDMCYIAGQVHLLGGKKCTFGPTYWCHTSAHAASCKASEYCKRKVWEAIQ